MTRSLPRLAAAALLAAGLSACSGDLNPVRDIAVGVGVGAKVPSRPDFVEATRPASTEYMPVGVSAPRPAVTRKTPAAVKAMEAELDGERAAHAVQAEEARRVGATPAPEPVKIEPIPVDNTPVAPVLRR
ncbi:MAG TPA: hypothetical protein VEA41_01745 [Salinarimonas sp.]|jgi:hypothetical protein|nr:hypothetical protein [Salinarimonas sp.]